LDEPAFDPAAFYAHVQATPKERNVLRQDLVRGLKDYFESIYGFDRYGAETIFHLSETLSRPLAYGYAMVRILNDRRIAIRTKARVADLAIELAQYGIEEGVPYGLFAALQFNASQGRLSTADLRYALVVSAGTFEPLRGVDRADILLFFRWLLDHEGMPPSERQFWGHSLIARHRDGSGVVHLIATLLGNERFDAASRRELCRAWVNHRQPLLVVAAPEVEQGPRGMVVAQHFPFWVEHSPSSPTPKMVHLGLVWLAKLGEDPLELAQSYLQYQGPFRDQVHGAVADILSEYHATMPRERVRTLIEAGLALSGESGTRRRFYQLGAELVGEEYLTRAATDSANRVRQWAARQLQR
jgi:hypothetical protein